MELESGSIRCSTLTISSDFLNSVRERQLLDISLNKVREQLGLEEATDFVLGNDGILRFRGRVCVPIDVEVKRLILEEGHKSRLSLHPGMTKMYQDLKEAFWWQGIKKDVTQFVSACLTCQKAKMEHQRPSGMIQPLEIPVWKWDNISMDFVTHLPWTFRGHDTI